VCEFFFFSDLLWSRCVSRTIYLMLHTAIVFCLRLFSLSSRTIPFPQCRQSAVIFCALFVFYPLSFPPKLLATCHYDVKVPQPVMFPLLNCSEDGFSNSFHQFFSELLHLFSFFSSFLLQMQVGLRKRLNWQERKQTLCIFSHSMILRKHLMKKIMKATNYLYYCVYILTKTS